MDAAGERASIQTGSLIGPRSAATQALKVIRLGIDSEQVIARSRERQAFAVNALTAHLS